MWESCYLAHRRRCTAGQQPLAWVTEGEARNIDLCKISAVPFWDIVWNGIVKKIIETLYIDFFFINSMIFFYVPYTHVPQSASYDSICLKPVCNMYRYLRCVVWSPSLPPDFPSCVARAVGWFSIDVFTFGACNCYIYYFVQTHRSLVRHELCNWLPNLVQLWSYVER